MSSFVFGVGRRCENDKSSATHSRLNILTLMSFSELDYIRVSDMSVCFEANCGYEFDEAYRLAHKIENSHRFLSYIGAVDHFYHFARLEYAQAHNIKVAIIKRHELNSSRYVKLLS